MMQAKPNRLGVGQRTRLLPESAAVQWPPPFRPRGELLRPLRAVRRAVLLVLWTVVAIPVQSVMLLLPGHAKERFARIYWMIFRHLMGVRLRVIGSPARRVADGARPVVFVSNHCSWLDVPVLGSALYACFVSKDEIANWPLISTVARLGRTVFVSRNRAYTGREREEMQRRLRAGDNLILFPEGTTSDGSRVLPFRSAFLSIAEGPDPPLIQPVSVAYDRLAGLPAGRAVRPIFAYYGDTSIGTHFWRLAQWRGLGVTMLLHPPLDPRGFPDRKALAQAVWATVAAGAAELRQNRRARPLPTAPRPQPAVGHPEFA
jgi:1-acyl-sn-glycerol-3-phosphate acyltransferase